MAAKPHKHDAAYDTGRLQVSAIHNLHYEQYGNSNGKPVVYLHGGPGGMCTIDNTVFFNPAIYRVVLFDQRGSGKSTPPAEIKENTSHDLVSDIETLREHLGIKKWHMVFGGSWGSALGLLYTQTHPEAVGSLVIRGVWTGRKMEIEFEMNNGTAGTAMLFPEAWQKYVEFLPPHQRNSPVHHYYRYLCDDSRPDLRREAAYRYNEWEFSISALEPSPEAMKMLADDQFSLTHARIECHYVVNGLFVEEGHVLRPENMARLKDIPGSIVQGRYDLVCPPRTAWEVHRAWPGSQLFMMPRAGHGVSEPGTKEKLIEICDEYAQRDFT